MGTEQDQSSRDGSLTPRYISGIGLFFLAVIAGEAVYVSLASNPLGTPWVAGVITSLPFVLLIIRTGTWLPDSSVSASRFKRIVFWGLGGLGVFVIVNVVIMVTMPPDTVFELVSWGRWAATLGAGVGFVIGIFDSRSTEQAVQAERERIRAEEAEKSEHLLNYLNATLRHEILNSVSIISGHTDLALAECDGNGQLADQLEIIKSQSQQMEAVIEDVRLLLEASQNQAEAGQVDVVELLTKEIEMIQDTHEAVSIEKSLPRHAVAEANRPVRRVFANILWNAVEHNDSDTPRIEVTVQRKAETVVVRIADNGPGIPEAEREALFDQTVRHDSNHGLGLPLAQTLVNSYDGTIEVTDTGPDGTLFTLTLQRASEQRAAGRTLEEGVSA